MDTPAMTADVGDIKWELQPDGKYVQMIAASALPDKRAVDATVVSLEKQVNEYQSVLDVIVGLSEMQIGIIHSVMFMHNPDSNPQQQLRDRIAEMTKQLEALRAIK